MIELKEVTKSFAGKKVLKKISFNIKKGEIVGLLGPNGAGKTTTMRLILGYLNPTSGVVNVGKFNPQPNRLEVSKLIGYLPENNPLWTELRVKDYLDFIAAARGVDKRSKRYEYVLRNCAIEEVEGEKIENLSRGYKQRVGLAGALLSDPEILILDEPTSGLDPIEQEKIRRLITSFQKKKTVIISTHILSEVETSCSRVLIISRGEIVYDGRVPKKRGELEKLFKKLAA